MIIETKMNYDDVVLMFEFLDDFDENLQLDPIIFYDFFGKYVPFSSKDNLDK